MFLKNFNFFLKKGFTFSFNCVHMFVQVSKSLWRLERALDHLEQELQVAVSCWT